MFHPWRTLHIAIMLNRRHLRIKICVLWLYQDEDRDVKRARQALNHSTQKMQELVPHVARHDRVDAGTRHRSIEAG